MRRATASLALLLACVACARTGATDPLSRAAARLRDVHSGVLSMALTVSTAEGPAGFRLHGPFEMRANKPVLARMDYVLVQGKARRSARFVSTGDGATVESNGAVTPIPQSSVPVVAAASGGRDLRVDRWLHDPRTTAGAQTDRITATLDVPRVVEDLRSLSSALGAPAAVPSGAPSSRDAIRRAVEDSTFELLVGHDGFLRSMHVRIRLGAPASAKVRKALGPLAEITIDWTVRLENVNATKV